MTKKALHEAFKTGFFKKINFLNLNGQFLYIYNERYWIAVLARIWTN